ncbi:hypothetical protein Nepgr_030988 [Nepenthes gracilis]|uniref:CG-1 domain-containing protein n=1 Tax=Nepenthes gracilis TaxID=150966 RepID=A0AAD3Y6C8_NEPGR|nr:hypothetical protein Nepgr_030988 [Nepenthes gracilis]
MDSSLPGRLSGWEVHGFRSMEDLDVANIVKEASGRWLRPNEIHAILSNYTCFTINVKPVNLPKGGTIVLFDRKMLRNFRKDGHNWKKKKDGKTVKEAHEHLKVGSEERIHVYYAHGQDNPKFVRRCYWLLDKALEHVVLVHYRETQEGSPFTPLNSHSGSELSDLSPSQLLLEETGSEDYNACYTGTEEQLQPDDSVDVRDHAMRLHEINSVDWDELLALNDPTYSSVPAGVGTGYFQPSDRYCMANVKDNGSNVSTSNLEAEMLSLGNPMEPLAGIGPEHVSNTANMLFQTFDGQINANEQNRVSEVGIAETGDVLKNLTKEDLQTQDSFGSWINDIVIPASVKDPNFDSSVSISHQSFLSPTMTNHESPIPQQIFCITDISPTWACTSEETKILVIGYFYEECQHLAKSTLFCICGEICVPAQAVQPGVFRCLISPHGSGSVNFYLSIDRCKPISQILTFELRSPIYNYVDVGEYKSKWEEFRVQMRLAVLLFSTSKYHDILSVKLSENALKEAKKFSLKTSNIANSWAYLIKLMENGNIPFSQAKDSLFELTLKNRLIEWLFERVVDGSKISERDVQGQGVLHLCAILGYTWAVYPFSLSGLSIDFRDKFGWTALHWAAYYGREKMVAALLSAGAKPNLVTDPTSENPGGCTAANLASQKGYHGLAAYLSEKALVQQFKDMKMAGNASGSLETVTYTSVDPSNFDEEDIYLKDTLAAYRTVADAAARIQAAFREHSLKQRTKAVQSSKPEIEARYIIAALKIQHAFRNYERRKIAAAAHIQSRFRTWKLRKEFLNLRRQAIKIQATFRGFQVRKQYRKILWSVGVLEKAVLRWRMKRRGFRGLQIGPSEALVDQKQESDTEEDFFQASRRQAEEHVVKAVVCVQSMFRSKQAQEEYTRMKLAHDAAMHESEESQLCYLLGVDRVDAPEN